MAFLFLILRHCSINNLLEEFEYDSTHPINLGIGFKEDEIPNFIGSFYSKTKAMTNLSFENGCCPLWTVEFSFKPSWEKDCIW
uniref:Uncharacterized protein n=1 Tax=Cucumis sativus TaxID=3659 RepID=A0A0A0KR13_CUCSA